MTVLAWRALWLLVFTIPCEEVFVLAGVGSASRLVGLVAVLTGVFAIFASGRFRWPAAFHLAAVAFVLWAALSLLWTIDAQATGIRVWTYAQVVAVTLLIWQLARDERRQHGLMTAYVLGTCATLIGIIANAVGGNNAYGVTGNAGFEYDERFVVAGFDPNDLGLTLALAVPLAWYLSLRTKSRLARLLYQLHVPAAVLAIILTGSRGALLALLVALLVVPLTIRRFPARRILAMVAVGAVTAYVTLQLVPSSVISRLGTTGEQIASGSFSARGGIWTTGLTAFFEQPLFGYGAGAFAEAVYGVSTGSLSEVAHNAFLSVLVEQGVVGLALLLLVLGLAVRSIPKMESLPRLMWIVMLLTWFTGVSALSWDYRKPTWLLFGLLTAYGATASMDYKERRPARAGRVSRSRLAPMPRGVNDAHV